MSQEKDKIIESTFETCHELYSKDEIELIVGDIFELGEEENKKVMERMTEMMNSLLIVEYEGLNIDDDDGLDEADRVVLDILESIGNL